LVSRSAHGRLLSSRLRAKHQLLINRSTDQPIDRSIDRSIEEVPPPPHCLCCFQFGVHFQRFPSLPPCLCARCFALKGCRARLVVLGQREPGVRLHVCLGTGGRCRPPKSADLQVSGKLFQFSPVLEGKCEYPPSGMGRMFLRMVLPETVQLLMRFSPCRQKKFTQARKEREQEKRESKKRTQPPSQALVHTHLYGSTLPPRLGSGRGEGVDFGCT